MSSDLPDIDTKFCCIVDWKQNELACAISSYLVKPGFYLPVFEFPSVSSGKSDADDEEIDEHIVSRIRSNEFDVFVHNAIMRIGGCENLILGGLTNEQKSYLSFLNDYNVIEINSLSEVAFYLENFEQAERNFLTTTVASPKFKTGLLTTIY